MNNINLEKQIIELIPSQTMKNAIKEYNHRFTDLEFVQLVEQFAKSWHSKLNLLNEIKENINNKDIISYIEAYVKSEHNAYDKFIKKEENYVYDIIMDCISNHDEESMMLPYNAIPDLVQFLAWAMRDRMEVTADAEADKVREQEGESERREV